MAKKRRKARSRTNPAKLGVRFDQTKALVVLRKGNAIDQAKILEKMFRIETEEVGVLTIKTKQIKTIILKNLPLFPLDVLRMLSGNEISGQVLTTPVHIDSEEVGGIARGSTPENTDNTFLAEPRRCCSLGLHQPRPHAL